MAEQLQKTDQQWKEQLTPEQYQVLRLKGTERPFTGEYVNARPDGSYSCAACGAALFSAKTQYDSHCGWPSFTDAIDADSVVLTPDNSHGMRRTEVTCRNCGGHLGHLFDDGPGPNGLRYCINSVSIQHEDA